MSTAYELGRGYVTLYVEDSKYKAGMAAAHKGLVGLGAAWNAAWGGGNAGLVTALARTNQLRRVVDDLANSVRAATRAYIGMAAAAGGKAGGAAALSSYIRAMGAAQAAINRSMGASSASVIRGAGSAASAIIRGMGTGTSSVIRGAGSGAAAVVRSVGAATSATLRGAATLVKSVTGPLASIVASSQRLGSGLLGKVGLLGGLAGGASAAGLGAVAVRDAMDLEVRMANIGRIAELDAAGLARMRRELTGMVATMPGIEHAKVFDVATMGAKMGVGAGALPLFTRDVAKLATVMDDIEPDFLVERIGRLLTVFDRGHEDTIRFASALNALDIQSTASAQDILDITTRFAGMAASFKMKPADSMALATTIRQAGIPLETGGTAMQQIFGRMSSKKDMGGFAKIAGMDKKSFGSMVNSDVLGAFTAVLKGLQKIEQARGPVALAQTLDKLHLDGQRVRGAFLQLVPAIDELERYTRTARDEFENLTSIEAGYAAKSKTTAAQAQLLKNNFWLMSAAIGTRLLPVVVKLADGLASLFQDIARYFGGDGGQVVEDWANWVGDKLHYVSVLWRGFPEILGLVQSSIAERLARMRSVFASFWEDISQGMKAHSGDLADNLAQLMTNAASAIDTLVVSVFVPVGQNIIIGILKGMDAYIDQLPRMLRAALAAAMPQFADFLIDTPDLARPGRVNPRKHLGGGDFVPVHPDTSGFSGDNMRRGLKPMPGFQFHDAPEPMGPPKSLADMDAVRQKHDELATARKREVEQMDEQAKRLRAKMAAEREAKKPKPGQAKPLSRVQQNRANRLAMNRAMRQGRNQFNGQFGGKQRAMKGADNTKRRAIQAKNDPRFIGPPEPHPGRKGMPFWLQKGNKGTKAAKMIDRQAENDLNRQADAELQGGEFGAGQAKRDAARQARARELIDAQKQKEAQVRLYTGPQPDRSTMSRIEGEGPKTLEELMKTLKDNTAALRDIQRSGVASTFA